MKVFFDYESLGFKLETTYKVQAADLNERETYRSNTGNDDFFFVHTYDKREDINTIMILHSKRHIGDDIVIKCEKDLVIALANEKHVPSLNKLRVYAIDEILENLASGN